MIELSVDQQAIRAVARALAAEADGKKLRRQLAADIRTAVAPAKEDIKARLMGMSTAGVQPLDGPPLRVVVAQQLKVEARLSGRSTGARVRIRARGPRGFDLAGRRLNRAKGWRHQVFGRDVWVQQSGEVGFFDEPVQRRHKEYRDAVMGAVVDAWKRIGRKAKG